MSAFSGPISLWMTNTDNGRIHASTKAIVQSGLILNYDAGASSSYPGSGSTWTDLSGNGFNGSLVGSPTYSSVNGGILVFNGGNYVNVTSNLGTLSGYTFCHWSRRDVENKMPIGARAVAQFYQFGDNSWYYTHSGTGEYYYPKAISIPAGTWGYYSITYDGSFVRIYRNAYFEGSQATTGTANWTSGVYIGATTLGGGFNYQGAFSSFQMYNRALSASEITQNYNVMRGRFGL